MVSVAALIIGLVALGFAAVVGRIGRRQQRRRSLVEDTETTEVRALAEEGLVELKGRVVPDDTFESPIRGDESVLSAWEVEEWDERGDSASWETRANGVYATPFTLDDGTGSVAVDVGDHVKGESGGHLDIQLGPLDLDRQFADDVAVDGVVCSFERFAPETTVPASADPPERIEEFVRGETGVSTQTDSITNVLDFGTEHNERRYYEGVVEPGEEIYLLGEARATADATYPLGPEDVVVGPPDGEGALIVSDKSEAALTAEMGRYKLAYAAAAVLAAVGAGLLASGAGVV